MNNAIAYIIYLCLALFIVIKIGSVLHKNGKVFLENNCSDKHLASNTNNILYIGYCLVNSGFAFYNLNTCETLKNSSAIMSFVSNSSGTLLLTLAIMHYLNMLIVPRFISFFNNINKINTNLLDANSNTKTTSHEL